MTQKMEPTNTDPTQLAISRSRHAHDLPASPVVLQAAEQQGTELPLLEIWRILAKRKFLILGFLAFCLFGAGGYIFLKKPSYEAVARVHIDPSQA